MWKLKKTNGPCCFFSHVNGHPINAKLITFQQNLPQIFLNSAFFFFHTFFLSLTVAILYTWAERGTVRIKCLAQECSQHNVTLQPGLGPGALDLETSALTTVPHGDNTVSFKQSNILW